ncbi:MAG: tetratricopeptide repeat protein, partial [Planctomycetota bacterium]
MRAGTYEKAAALLLDARADDPFRAWEADRALSRLAEITENPEEADAFITAALAGSPRDAWSLFQAGRLARAAGDDARARAAYQAALEVELDFAPAMARLAELLEEAGDLASAERYYERLAMLEPDNAALRARRGWNALSLGDVDLARASFDRARDIDLGSESARAGLAWWHYATGEPGEALTLFGEIVDDARSDDREGPWSAFSETEAARILDHESKEVFRDRFDRADGRIANGWTEDKGVGPLSDLSKGAVRIEGSHQKSGRTRVFRQLPPDRFIAFTAALTVGDDARGTRSGLFVASERTSRRGEVEVRAELAVCRNRDGEIEVRIQKKSTDGDAAFRAVSGPEWPQGKAVRVSIERRGEDLDSRFTLLVDGEPVETDLQIDALFSSRQNLSFGAFVEGEPGRVADLVVDDVRVVRRK